MAFARRSCKSTRTRTDSAASASMGDDRNQMLQSPCPARQFEIPIVKGPHYMRFIRVALLGVLSIAAVAVMADETAVFSLLKSTVPVGKQAGDYYLVPTNQLLKPWGEQAVVPGRPVDMTFDAQKRILAVLNWRSVLLLDGTTGMRLGEVASRATSYAGIAFRPGNRELWASEASGRGPDSIMVTQVS